MFNRADLTVGGGKKLSRTYLIDKFQIKKSMIENGIWIVKLPRK